MRSLLSGLPVGLGFALYSFAIYLFSQVPAVPTSAGVQQITYGSLSFGVQVISSLISIILMSSTMLILACANSFIGNRGNYSGRTEIRRLITISCIAWFIIGLIVFFVAPIFTDAMRITSSNEINITLIGLRVCALTIWAHSLLWMLIQYYVIKRNHKMWISLSAPLLLGFILMVLVINLLPDKIIVAWLLFAFTPFLSLLVAWIFHKKFTQLTYIDSKPDVLTRTTVMERVKSSIPSIKKLILSLVAAILFVGVLIFSTLSYYEVDMLPDITNEKLFNFENRSKVVANDGVTVLSDIYFPRHETIENLDEVSPYVVQAIVAREDCRFYEHNGVDLKGIARAAFSVLTGQGIQGGSTITMQLVKNSILSNTSQLRTFDRKISEIFLAYRMERFYDKNTILTMYLNNTNFGNGYYGIKSASRHYFRKDPKDLTLAEAVSLSTLIQRPNDSRLTSNDEFALSARTRTLNSMARDGYITKDQAAEASSQLLNWDPFEVIINHSKVSPALTYDPIIKDNVAYMSVDDVTRYFDSYLYQSGREGIIATFGTGGVAEINLDDKTITINDETKPIVLQKVGYTYYMPLQNLADLYGIDIYQDDNTLLITSRDRATISAKVVSDTPINYLNSEKSYSVGTAHKGDTVYVKDTEGDVYEGWSRVRTNDNLVGYVKSDTLTGQTVEKQAVPTAEFLEFDEPLRITWDSVVSYKSANNIITESNGAYNIVMPFCYGVSDGKVYDRNDTVNDNYIQMYEDEGFYCFPTFDSVPQDGNERKALSNLLNSYYSRKDLIKQILSFVDTNHLKGINIDFEHMFKSDAKNYTRFIRELKAQLEPRGCLLFIDVTAPDGDPNWSGCYEYWKLGMATDYMILLAYNYTSKSSDTPGSGAPYYWVHRSVDKIVNRESVSSDKLILALPLYMQIWDLNSEKDTVIGSRDCKISEIDELIPEDASITWLKKEQQHLVEFTENGVPKQLWKEDIDSLAAKMQLIPEYNLPGVAFWIAETSNAEINLALAQELDKVFDKSE